jgi:hypothetical protein
VANLDQLVDYAGYVHHGLAFVVGVLQVLVEVQPPFIVALRREEYAFHYLPAVWHFRIIGRDAPKEIYPASVPKVTHGCLAA